MLDQLLASRTWLVGDRLSHADFRVASALPFATAAFATAAGLPLAELPQMRRWHDQLLAIEAWRCPFAGLEGAGLNGRGVSRAKQVERVKGIEPSS